jgi:hypothetical protein
MFLSVDFNVLSFRGTTDIEQIIDFGVSLELALPRMQSFAL